MSIAQYAQERLEWGGQPPSEEEVAAAYIKLALASRDPVQMLLPAVRAAVFETFRARRQRIEDRAWKVMPTASTGTRDQTTTGPARTKVRTNLGISHVPSTLNAITIFGSGTTTGTNGMVLSNINTATSGNVKVSPQIKWSGNALSTGGSTSGPVSFYAGVTPIQGTTATGNCFNCKN